MDQVCLLWSMYANVRSGGFLLGRSGDVVLVQFVVYSQKDIFFIKVFSIGDQPNQHTTILASELLTAAVPILPAFPNTRQAFLADF